MMLKYGPTLSEQAFHEAIDQLYAPLVAAPQKRIPDEVLRQELDLTIDHRLGVWFPRERRNHVWLVQQRIAAKYLSFGRAKAIMYWLVSFVRPQVLVNKMAELNEFAADELESVFTKEELLAFAGGTAVSLSLPTAA